MPRIAKPRRHGKRWRFSYLDADGARQWESHATYKEAEAAMRRCKTEVQEILAGTRDLPPAPRTFSVLCDYWLEHRAAYKRSKKDDESCIRAHLRPAFGDKLLTEVDLRAIDRLRSERRHLSAHTMRNYLMLLTSMLNLAEELGWLLKVPKVKKPVITEQEYRWLKSREDLEAFLRAAREESEGVFELYAAAVFTGMRAGELLGLRWSEVDLDRRLITVLRSYDKPTKTGAIRHVPILDPLLPVLRAWKLECPSDWVFPGLTGEPQAPSARVLQEVLKRVLIRGKLLSSNGRRKKQGRSEVPPTVGKYDRITFHDLRHTFASHWVMQGGDLYRLQKILGHRSVQMTQRYAHLAPEVFKQDWGRLGTELPGAEKEGKVLPLTK